MSKKKGKDDGKAQRSYNEAMLKSYKYAPPKDRRSEAEKMQFREEAKKWAGLIAIQERDYQTFEQKRLDYMWESIMAVPEGALREACLVQDHAAPPDVMQSLILTDIGPIPDSEVERLDPFVIDHSLLQRMGDEGGALVARQRAAAEERKKKAAKGKRKGKK